MRMFTLVLRIILPIERTLQNEPGRSVSPPSIQLQIGYKRPSCDQSVNSLPKRSKRDAVVASLPNL